MPRSALRGSTRHLPQAPHWAHFAGADAAKPPDKKKGRTATMREEKAFKGKKERKIERKRAFLLNWTIQ